MKTTKTLFVLTCMLTLLFVGCGEDDDASENGQRCEDTDPTGLDCTSSDDCAVTCHCEDGEAAGGFCFMTICASLAHQCESSCEEDDQGEFTGDHCYVGGKNW